MAQEITKILWKKYQYGGAPELSSEFWGIEPHWQGFQSDSCEPFTLNMLFPRGASDQGYHGKFYSHSTVRSWWGAWPLLTWPQSRLSNFNRMDNLQSLLEFPEAFTVLKHGSTASQIIVYFSLLIRDKQHIVVESNPVMPSLRLLLCRQEKVNPGPAHRWSGLGWCGPALARFSSELGWAGVSRGETGDSHPETLFLRLIK